MSLANIVRSINEDLSSHSSMSIGAIVTHPDGYKVKIISGCFLDSIYHRVSNWWTWRRVLKNGKLGKSVSGYGW